MNARYAPSWPNWWPLNGPSINKVLHTCFHFYGYRVHRTSSDGQGESNAMRRWDSNKPQAGSGQDDIDRDVEALRARSAAEVTVIYSLIAFGCALLALAFHFGPPLAGLEADPQNTVANAFCAIGALNLVLLSVWESVFLSKSSS